MRLELIDEVDVYPYQTTGMIPNFSCALRDSMSQAIEYSLPFLKGDFPPLGQFNFETGYDDEVCLITMHFKNSGIPSMGTMKPEKFAFLKEIIGRSRGYSGLKALKELNSYFEWDKFIIALEVNDGSVDYHTAQGDVIDWLNDVPLARAYRHNAERVKAAIPTPPQYSLAAVQKSMWVLECDETMVQGTAFEIEKYGVITNEHVVNEATALVAFQVDSVGKKYSTRILLQNSALDLAIIEIIGAPKNSALSIELGEVKPMAHVAVCGFPNYRLGDSGVLIPGLIVGLRPKSGVQRLLTNAPIVAGMSGGPALGAGGNVIGVCVTGSKFLSSAGDTEDHSIIPISALELLGG